MKWPDGVRAYVEHELATARTRRAGEEQRDALAEVGALRYNILHAFLESAAHPHDVHGLPVLIPEARAATTHGRRRSPPQSLEC
jgi:hypothetical protein